MGASCRTDSECGWLHLCEPVTRKDAAGATHWNTSERSCQFSIASRCDGFMCEWYWPVLVGGIVVAGVGLVALPFYLAYRLDKKPALSGLPRRRRKRR